MTLQQERRWCLLMSSGRRLCWELEAFVQRSIGAGGSERPVGGSPLSPYWLGEVRAELMVLEEVCLVESLYTFKLGQSLIREHLPQREGLDSRSWQCTATTKPCLLCFPRRRDDDCRLNSLIPVFFYARNANTTIMNK